MKAGPVTMTSARAAAFNDKDKLVRDGDFLAECIALESYRSLRRYATRHIAPGGDALVRKLLRLPMEDRAARLSNDERSLNAWAIALWSMDLEAHAFARHWHTGGETRVGGAGRWLILNKDAIAMELNVRAPVPMLRGGQCEWLLGHATMAIIQRRFVQARAIAVGMVSAGMVELEGGLIGPNSLGLGGELLASGELRFTTDTEEEGALPAPPVARSKDERRLASAEAARQRQEDLTRICAGLCLRFTWRDGWGVVSATVPDIAGGVHIRRNRLFAEGRPPFILFATSVGYCARLVGIALEVHDDEPWTAIDTLRYAYTRHLRLTPQRPPPARDGCPSAGGEVDGSWACAAQLAERLP